MYICLVEYIINKIINKIMLCVVCYSVGPRDILSYGVCEIIRSSDRVEQRAIILGNYQ